MNLTVHNIKLSLKIPCIDLKTLREIFPGEKKSFRNYFLVQDRFNWTFFKHRSLGKSNVLESSGPTTQHVNVTSIKKFEEIPDVISHLCGKIGISPNSVIYKIDNISAKLKLNPIDIEKFQFFNQDLKTQYNIEKFPGLFIKKKQQSVLHAKGATFILFSSGKVNIVGASSLEIVKRSAQWISERCAPIQIV